MIALNAHFDGKVIVPDTPLALPANQKLRIHVEPIETNSQPPAFPPKRALGLQRGSVRHIAEDFDAELDQAFWLGKEPH